MSIIYFYKDLIVWQKAMEVVAEVYQLTSLLPRSEIYGLAAQMRRSVISIPSNIAEGRRRATRKEFCCFLNVAYSSGAELETQIEICKRLAMVPDYQYEKLEAPLLEVMKLLNKITATLRTN